MNAPLLNIRDFFKNIRKSYNSKPLNGSVIYEIRRRIIFQGQIYFSYPIFNCVIKKISALSGILNDRSQKHKAKERSEDNRTSKETMIILPLRSLYHLPTHRCCKCHSG